MKRLVLAGLLLVPGLCLGYSIEEAILAEQKRCQDKVVEAIPECFDKWTLKCAAKAGKVCLGCQVCGRATAVPVELCERMRKQTSIYTSGSCDDTNGDGMVCAVDIRHSDPMFINPRGIDYRDSPRAAQDWCGRYLPY